MIWKRLREPTYVGRLVMTKPTDRQRIMILIVSARHRSVPGHGMEKAAKDQVCRLAMTKTTETEWINILIFNARHTGLFLVMAWKRLRQTKCVG